MRISNFLNLFNFFFQFLREFGGLKSWSHQKIWYRYVLECLIDLNLRFNGKFESNRFGVPDSIFSLQQSQAWLGSNSGIRAQSLELSEK